MTSRTLRQTVYSTYSSFRIDPSLDFTNFDVQKPTFPNSPSVSNFSRPISMRPPTVATQNDENRFIIPGNAMPPAVSPYDGSFSNKEWSRPSSYVSSKGPTTPKRETISQEFVAGPAIASLEYEPHIETEETSFMSNSRTTPDLDLSFSMEKTASSDSNRQRVVAIQPHRPPFPHRDSSLSPSAAESRSIGEDTVVQLQRFSFEAESDLSGLPMTAIKRPAPADGERPPSSARKSSPTIPPIAMDREEDRIIIPGNILPDEKFLVTRAAPKPPCPVHGSRPTSAASRKSFAISDQPSTAGRGPLPPILARPVSSHSTRSVMLTGPLSQLLAQGVPPTPILPKPPCPVHGSRPTSSASHRSFALSELPTTSGRGPLPPVMARPVSSYSQKNFTLSDLSSPAILGPLPPIPVRPDSSHSQKSFALTPSPAHTSTPDTSAVSLLPKPPCPVHGSRPTSSASRKSFAPPFAPKLSEQRISPELDLSFEFEKTLAQVRNMKPSSSPSPVQGSMQRNRSRKNSLVPSPLSIQKEDKSLVVASVNKPPTLDYSLPPIPSFSSFNQDLVQRQDDIQRSSTAPNSPSLPFLQSDPFQALPEGQRPKSAGPGAASDADAAASFVKKQRAPSIMSTKSTRSLKHGVSRLKRMLTRSRKAEI